MSSIRGVRLALAAASLCAGMTAVASTDLEAVLDATTEDAPGQASAHGADVLALPAGDRIALERWLRRGGRLSLLGEGARAAADLLGPGADRAVIGLGEVVLGGVASPDRPGSYDDIARAAADLAVTLPAQSADPRRALAARLFLFGVVVVLGFSVWHRVPAAPRGAVAVAAVLLFALAPWWEARAPWGEDRLAQVDVLVTAEDGPSLLWSGAALRASTRHAIEVEPVPDAWDLRVLRPRRVGTPEVVSDPATGVHRLRVASTRGGEVSLAWLAERPASEPRVTLEVVERNGLVLGVARNASTQSWKRAWLLLPGRGAIQVADLPSGGARIVSAPEPLAGGAGPDDVLALGLDPVETRLMAAVRRRVVDPLLARGLPVLVAWSDTPARPARLGARGSRGSIERGRTLIVSQASRPSPTATRPVARSRAAS